MCVFSYVAAGSERRLQQSRQSLVSTPIPPIYKNVAGQIAAQSVVSAEPENVDVDKQVAIKELPPKQQTTKQPSQSARQLSPSKRQLSLSQPLPSGSQQQASHQQHSLISSTPEMGFEAGSVTPVGGPPSYPPPALPVGVQPPAAPPCVVRPSKPPPIPTRNLPHKSPSLPQPPPRPQ